MRNYVALAVAFLTALVAVPAAATPAAGLDYSGITGAIDLTTTVTAIVAIGGIVALVKVATMGVRKVLSMIR